MDKQGLHDLSDDLLTYPFKDHREDIEMPLMYDQGKCNCCCLIQTAGSIECAIKILMGILSLHLSPQQLIDCNEPTDKTTYDDCGCYPYRYEKSFEYALQVGLREECNYPFVGQRGPCKALQPGEKCWKIKGYKFVKECEQSLMKIVDLLPVAAAVRCTNHIKSLKEGIYMGPEPGETDRRHAVLIVGYGSEFCHGVVKNYWLVKNSWGTAWGIDGYGKICRDSSLPNGMKTLITRPVYPILHP